MGKINSVAAGFCLAFASLGLTAAPASAGMLIDNGMTTIDTYQNLEWLDLTESLNLSYNYVESQFGTGGAFEGWRHATGDEVALLFSNAGFPAPYSSSPASTAMSDLIAMLGVTYENPTYAVSGSYRAAGGYYNDTTSPPPASQSRVGYAFLGIDDRVFDVTPPPVSVYDYNYASIEPDQLSPSSSYDTDGNWLVHEYVAVPEPMALALLATGMVPIGLARRRRTRKAAA